MYYTNNQIRLVSIVKEYLLLIQEVNNRYENKRSLLARYDATKNMFANIRLMHRRENIVSYMERMKNLSEWLILRMQSVLMELNQENDKQLRKILSNEVQTIEL